MSKFLVTGGAGFIGSNFLHYAVSKYPNDQFVCLDALTYAGNFNNIKSLTKNDNFKFVKGNITDKNMIDNLFNEEKFDYVINFAAETHVDNSFDNADLFLKTNILGTQVLLDASLKYNVKKYHQIYTDEVYGDMPIESTELFTENSMIKPSNPYSAAKASADLLVLSYYKTHKLPVTISRCSNNYGPHQYPEKLIPVIISNALMDKPIPIHGNGLNVRDWINVKDHISGIDLVVRKGKAGEVYNFGGHAERSNIEIAKIILNYLNKPLSLINYVSNRPGNDLRYAMDSSKVEKELGWQIGCNFEDGIKETIDWYVNNKKWIEDIISGEYLNSYNKEN